MKNKLVLILSILTLTFYFGCGKKAIIRKYYILEIPQSQAPDSTKMISTLPVHVEVKNFEVGKAFDQAPIALRTNSHELNYYFYHHWAVKPGIAIGDMTYSYLSQHNYFENVSRGFTADSDFSITGHVYTIERLEEDKNVYAHVHLKFEFQNQNLSKTLLHHEFDRKTPVKDKNRMNPIAYELSLILEEELDNFIHKVIDYIQSNEGTS